MPDIKLIALDLDGTLYTTDGKITPHTKEVLSEAVASGVTVIISTGRPFIGLPLSDMADIGITYAITANGAAVYHIPEPNSKVCLYENCMEPALCAKLLDWLYQHHLHLDAFIEGDAYTQESTRSIIDELNTSESLRTYIRDTRTAVPNLAQFILENHKAVQKFTVNFPPDDAGNYPLRAKVAATLDSSDDLTYVSGGFTNLEITKKGISKAKGLQILCDALDIPVSSVMACGDSQNDLDIVNAAGLGIAMANAEQLLLDAADFVSLSNNEDGVAYAVEKYVLHR